MRGYPRYNFDAFEAASQHLEESGLQVLAPHRKDLAAGFDPDRELDEQGFDLREALRWDTAAICRSDFVFALFGWRDSRGARAEVALAQAVGIPVWEQMESDDYRWLHVPDDSIVAQPRELPLLDSEPITSEAHRIVYGDRGEAYGPPTEDFTRTATMWSAILAAPVTAKQVALCMVALKISREIHKSKRDNLVDLCGYALCAWRVETGE